MCFEFGFARIKRRHVWKSCGKSFARFQVFERNTLFYVELCISSTLFVFASLFFSISFVEFETKIRFLFDNNFYLLMLDSYTICN